MKSLPFESIKNRYTKLAPALNEMTRRRWAAVEAEEIGYGGIAAVAKATGLTPRTIRHGIKELNGAEAVDTNKQRKAGGGRKASVDKQPKLLEALENLV